MATKANKPEEIVNAEETEKRVKIRLNTLENDDGHVDQTVTVGMNGYMLNIKRGETVAVPEWAYKILKNCRRFPEVV